MSRRAIVLRDGAPVELDAAELVVGDVVLLKGGDRISADVELGEVDCLSIDASTLSGESVPLTPQARERVLAGTFVVEGEATGVVVATGATTRLANIARMTHAGRRPPTPLALELSRVVRIIALVAVAVGVTFLAIAILVLSDTI